MNEEGIVCRLREFRNREGLTQLDLADAVGVSRQTIISIERGRYVPSLPLALKLARHYGCAAEDLFSLQ